MCKYSDNFFFTSNNILRVFSLSIYIMSPPLHPPFPSEFYTKTNNFPTIFLAQKKTYAYLCSGLEMMVVHSDRAAVIAQH